MLPIKLDAATVVVVVVVVAVAVEWMQINTLDRIVDWRYYAVKQNRRMSINTIIRIQVRTRKSTCSAVSYNGERYSYCTTEIVTVLYLLVARNTV